MARMVQVAPADDTAEADELRELLQSAGIDPEIGAEGDTTRQSCSCPNSPPSNSSQHSGNRPPYGGPGPVLDLPGPAGQDRDLLAGFCLARDGDVV
jgi:hypothetical protein